MCSTHANTGEECVMSEASNAVSVRVEGRSMSETGADIRHNERSGRVPGYVDSSRSSDNSSILPAPTPYDFKTECVKRRDQDGTKQRKMRSNAAVSTSMIITFGKGVQNDVNNLSKEIQDRMYHEIATAVAQRLATDLQSLYAHRDETAPHAHGQMLAINKHGTPVSKTTSKRVLSELQDIAFEIARQYVPNVERGVRKKVREERGDDPNTIYNRDVKQLHDQLPREIEEMKRRRDDMIADYRSARDRTLKTEARLLDAKENLAEAGEHAERMSKRINTYESRLATQQGKLEAKALEIDRLDASISEKKDTFDTLSAKTEEKSEELDRVSERLEGAKAKLIEKHEAITQTDAELGEREQEKLEVSTDLAAMRDDLDALRPAWAAAQLIKAHAAEMSPDLEADLRDEFNNHLRSANDFIAFAAPLRLADPLFAPDLLVEARSTDLQSNAETVRNLSEDTRREVSQAVRAEPGSDSIKAIVEESTEHDNAAMSWLTRAWEGFKRGIGLSRTTDEKDKERTGALAAVFESLPDTTRQALNRLFSSSSQAVDEKTKPQQHRSLFKQPFRHETPSGLEH